LSDEDRTAIIDIARQALAPFQPKPEPSPGPAVPAAAPAKANGPS
jgi:hypothetical protein